MREARIPPLNEVAVLSEVAEDVGKAVTVNEELNGVVIENEWQIRNDLLNRGSITRGSLKTEGEQSIFSVVGQYLRVDLKFVPICLVEGESFHAAPLEVDS